MTDISCREFVEFLMGYLDQTLPAGERSTFVEHMDACPSCVTYLETYRETVRLGREVCRDPEGPVPEEVPDLLVSAILAARKSSA